MTSKFITATVLAAAALTSFAASAENFNPYLWDQMKAPTAKTRAQVKAEVLQAPQDASATSMDKSGAKRQTNPLSVKTGGQ